jgi:hypothetical protein
MAEPDWNPDTAGRSLAEILREAGIESASRAARRRSWDDPEETGIRQRRAEAAAAEHAGYGRRKSDHDDFEEPPPARDRPDFSRPAPEPHTAAIPGLRPERKPGVPVSSAQPSAPVVLDRQAAAPVERRGSQRGSRPGSPRGSQSEAGPPEQRAPEERAPQQSSQRASQRAAQRAAQRAPRVDEHPSTGPIPVVRPEEFDDAGLDATPKESALAWLRFAGELLIAVAAGVAVYFTARVLWEMAPYGAMLLAPLAVTGLTSGVGMWRHRQGREPAGPLLLAALVFAGTLLTIAPAAELLAGS